MEIQTLTVAVAAGKTSVLRYARADGAARAAIVLMPALGVAARYYEPLMKHFAAQGVDAAALDLQGQGASSVRASRPAHSNYGYRELLHEDWPAAIAAARQVLTPEAPLFLMGHSLGGQLSSLYLGQQPTPPVAGLVLCASGTVYYKAWGTTPLACVRLLALTQLAALISQVLGHFPGDKLRFGGRSAQRLICDWAAQARTGRYSVRGSPLDWEGGMRGVTLPVLCLTLDSDTLAPASAADHLVGKLPQAALTRLRLPGPGLNHFTWVKQPGVVAPSILGWVDDQLRRSAAA